MKMSKLYLPTLKETPVEAEIASHKLMLRAGLMRSLSAGIYSFLPLGNRVLRKIEDIIRTEMDKCSQEVSLPVMQTADIWKESKRWKQFGPLMIKFKDRKEREYCLGPTHEEVITDLIRDEVRSYKDLPLNLYQIQTKVRDEIRPRFGVMRGREFIMKDAYSMDRNFAGLDESYQIMYDAYNKIFANCSLETRVVEADTGAMGGKDSHEFMVLAESGEDEIALCTECDYAANVEKANSRLKSEISNSEKVKTMQIKKTPGIKTIEQLEEFLEEEASKMIKSLALLADGKPVLILVRGDDELNEVKLKNYLKAQELIKVDNEDFPELFNSLAGFIGPVGMKNIPILADHKIKDIKNGITGANKKDQHYINVNPDRDFKVDEYTDLRKVKAGEGCPHCDGKLEIKSGIEVGHIFKLGTKYSKNMNATYLDENGKEQPIVMGSYGIGVTRLIAAAIEQNYDENGIIWPKAIAPYHVIILPLGGNNDVQQTANDLYKQLNKAGIETLIDDRSERAGVKFNDAELIGIPVRVTIGSRSLSQNVIEVQIRKSGEMFEFPVKKAKDEIVNLLSEIE